MAILLEVDVRLVIAIALAIDDFHRVIDPLVPLGLFFSVRRIVVIINYCPPGSVFLFASEWLDLEGFGACAVLLTVL